MRKLQNRKANETKANETNTKSGKIGNNNNNQPNNINIHIKSSINNVLNSLGPFHGPYILPPFEKGSPRPDISCHIQDF